MPIANIRYSPRDFPHEQLKKLQAALPGIIARELSSPENPSTKLDPSQIMLEFSEVHWLDTNARPFRILIFAEGYAERLRNIDERAEFIARQITFISSFFTAPGFVCVWIYPSSKTGYAHT